MSWMSKPMQALDDESPTDSEASLDFLLSRHWHHLPEDEVKTLLDAQHSSGLDLFDVQNRRADFGHNLLTQKKGISPLVLFLSQFNQPLIYILLIAALVTFLLQEWVDSTVIFAVVLVNAIIGYVQESKAIAAIAALAKSMEGSARVIRAGETIIIPASELVPGDLVLLQSGDKVPADLRLLQTRELNVNESALTGESLPTLKQAGVLAKDTLLADRTNMAYSSTLVTYGSATGLVVSTGDYSEIGRINALVAKAATIATPLTLKFTEFSQKLLWIILLLAGVTFIAGWLHGNPMLDNFMASVALAVSVIPEGLPAAMTIILAIGVSKMAQRNAIVRKMPAVETLGSTTVICSDKTGTLTQNQMTVQQIYAGGQNYSVTGVGYDADGRIFDSTSQQAVEQRILPGALLACLRCGVLCNDAHIRETQEGWKYEGDPTELAMLTVAMKADLSLSAVNQAWPRLDSLPFESQHQYMATLHKADHGCVLLLKGSVEAILARCTAFFGSDEPFDTEAVLQQVHAMGEKGLRVLAFASKNVLDDTPELSHQLINHGFQFLGLQAMMDPPRVEAIQSVAVCQNAGIQVKMITGDHLITAAAIARQIGIQGTDYDEYDRFAISGKKLAQMTDHELVEVANRIAVFARVSPEQKLRLVEALQAEGHVVAMTGDGVNDAPALKQSNIGVAMGVSGTEVAKESADMVLTNDNFATIEAAVEEGRAVYDNLIKFITWTLPTNVGEGLIVLVAVLFGLTLPITPVQILWINMTTAVFLGLMLAFENKEPGLMERTPRDPSTPVITMALALRMATVSVLLLIAAFGLFTWALEAGRSIEHARTLAVNMFVFGEMFYLLNCRSLRYSMFKLGIFSNHWLIMGVLCMIAMQLWLTYVPFMNHVFGTAPVTLIEWGVITGCAFIIYTVVGFEKWFRRRMEAQALPSV